MKVLDIISESKIDSFINSVLKGVAWSMGRGPAAKAAEELAEAWLRKMMEAGTTRVSMPINVIRDPVLAADRRIMDEAYKEAVKAFRKAERAGLIQDIKAGAGAAAEKIATGVQWSKNLFIFFAYVGSMFHASSLVSEYNKLRKELDQELESGSIDEATHRSDIGRLRLRLIGELALVAGTVFAGMVTAGAAVLSAKAGSFMIRLLTFNKWKDALGPVASLYSAASAGAQYYFVYKLSVDKVAREKLIDLVTSDNIVMNNLALAAADPANHPFVLWAKKIFAEAESQQDQTPEPQSRPKPSGNTSPKPNDDETTGIDWSKAR